MLTYYHQLDPFLIHFSGNIGIRWYSLAYIAGAVSAYFIGIYLIKKGRINLPDSKLTDIVIFGALGAVLGGRVGYCAFYSPELFLSFNRSFPFWGLFKIYEGGMSSHGGILGFILSQMFYSYRHKLSFFTLMDLGVVGAGVGIFLGRIANFINGELYGRVVEGTTWFAVRFPTELYLWASQPELYKKQLISLKVLLPVLNSSYPSSVRIPGAYNWEEWVLKAGTGDSVYGGYISHICHLIVTSSNKIPIKELLEPLLFLRYPSQLYQSVLGGLLPLFILCLVWLKVRKAGLIALVWLLSYLSFRIITEFYRQPDPQIGFELFYLTRGQWLSFCLYLVALVCGYFVYKQKPKGFS